MLKSRVIQTAMHLMHLARRILCRGHLESENALCASYWRKMPFNVDCACKRFDTPAMENTETLGAECDVCVQNPPLWGWGWTVSYCNYLSLKMLFELKHGDRTELAAPTEGWMAQIGTNLLTESTLIITAPVY